MADVAVEPLRPTFETVGMESTSVAVAAPELPRGVEYGVLGILIAIEFGWLLAVAFLLYRVL